MKCALVTGSYGFVGRHMVAELVARGWLVDGHDIADHPLLDCMETFRGPTPTYDLVIHCAARAPHRAAIDGQPASTVYNRMLDAAMFEWAIRTGQRRVLYLSSCAVYPLHRQGPHDPPPAAPRERLREFEASSRRIVEGRSYPIPPDPPDAYGWAKLSGEQMAEAANAAGVPTHVVRPFSGYGEDQGEDFPFGAFAARARRREDPFMIWGDGTQVRDWINVDDVVNGALAVVDADVREPVNLCTGVGVSMFELAQMMCEAAGYNPVYAFRPDAPAGVAWRVGDPTRMRQVYTPRVDLAEGVARALSPLPA